MVPKLEIQKAINEHLKTAEKLCDEALSHVCEAAALAIKERHFIYSEAIAQTAEIVNSAKCRCFARIVTIDEKKDKKEPD